MRRVKRIVLIVLMLLLALATAPAAWAAPSGGGKGNTAAAKACQKGGWAGLVRSDGTAFTSEEACVSYAAKGGTLQPKPTATLTVTNSIDPVARISEQIITGSGLLPDSEVLWTQTVEGREPFSDVIGYVAGDGTLDTALAVPCGRIVSATLSATTASGGTITADAYPGC
jgi:hypothetical protein